MNKLILHTTVLVTLIAAAAVFTSCGREQHSDIVVPPGDGKVGPDLKVTVDAGTAMIFKVQNDVRLKAKGAADFVRILGGLFRGGDELQVGAGATAWVSCADDRICPLGQGLYTDCCKGTCEHEIRMKPPEGEPVRALMKKQDLPANELQLFETSEARIRSLGANEAATQFLIANLYSSWKLVEANNELDKLSQTLKTPEAVKQLDNLYAPMVRKTGDLYLEVNQKGLAEQSYKKAVEVAPQTNDPRDQADAHIKLGEFYENSGQRDKAVVNLKQGQQLYEKSGEAEKAAATRRALSTIEKP